MKHVKFESNVNSDSIQTICEEIKVKSEFESNVNSDSIQTCQNNERDYN